MSFLLVLCYALPSPQQPKTNDLFSLSSIIERMKDPLQTSESRIFGKYAPLKKGPFKGRLFKIIGPKRRFIYKKKKL